MGMFPFFTDIRGRTGLVIGGGNVALRKAGKLEPFGARLIVIAPQISAEFAGIKGVESLERAFEPEDIRRFRPAFVLAASGDREVNRAAAAECARLGIPVNVADDASLCTFQFPALVCRGGLTIGISTGGKSPGAAVDVRRLIEGALPENIEAYLDEMDALRERLKRTVPSQAERAELLRKAWAGLMTEGQLPKDI